MYLGIDVHKRNSYVAVLDEDGEVLEEGRVLDATLEEIAQQYAGSHAVIESTTNYYAIYDTLAEYLDVTVANPAKTRVIAEADLKNDRVDAKRLAHLLRAGLVAESYVPPTEIRECRALVRGRKHFVENRTEYANKIHRLLTQRVITRSIKPLSSNGRAFLEELSLPAPWQRLLEAYLDMIDALTDQIAHLESGPGRLRWILVQCAHVAVHSSHDEYLSRFYERLERRKSSKEAIVATARKLLVSIYYMLDRKEVYDPPGVSD